MASVVDTSVDPCHENRPTAERATPPCILAVCTDERRHGPSREHPPLSPTGTEYGQGGGRRGTRRSTTRRGDRSHLLSQRPLADAGTQTGDDAEYTVQFVIPQEHISQRIVEQSVDTPFPQAVARTVESENVEPVPAAARRRWTGKYGACAAAEYAAPATLKEYVAPAPADTNASPAPETEYAPSPSPAVAYAGPTPVIDSAASAPAYSCASPAPVTTAPAID